MFYTCFYRRDMPKKTEETRNSGSKHFDLWAVNKEVMLEYGPNTANICLGCDNQCKRTIYNEQNPCNNYKTLKHGYSWYRSREDYGERYNRHYKKGRKKLHKFLLDFYKDTDNKFYGKNGICKIRKYKFNTLC